MIRMYYKMQCVKYKCVSNRPLLRLFISDGCRLYSSTSSSSHQSVQSRTAQDKEDCRFSSSPKLQDDIRKKLGITFRQAELGSFTQVPPHQENLFTNNAFLTNFVQRVFPKEILSEIWDDLVRFGKAAVTDLHPVGRECELNQPYIKKYDAWGNKIDKLETSQAWKSMKAITAREGIVATAYDGKYGEYDRLYQIVKLYLFCSVSGLYSCPVAMTDGAAKTALITGSPVMKKAFTHLTSRDPEQFWTSGQWMTEKRGGSDVSGGTETLAVEQDDGNYQLFGYKWFSSATDSDMALTLANIVSEEQPVPKAKGLAMFYLETRNNDGKLNGIEIINLKNKLGTRQLPTAELLLDGAQAHQVSAEGRGIASIADMLTITRIHNSVAAISNMRRIVMLARDYSQRRYAFGSNVRTHPLHQLTAARQDVITRGCEALVFHAASLLGKEEAGTNTEVESLVLRIITPIMKMFTAKCAMQVISEGLECFGGQGYIEDTGLPSMLRDAQVLPIWEGTSNIMSLDFLRAVFKTNGKALFALNEDIQCRLKNIEKLNDNCLDSICKSLNKSVGQLYQFMESNPNKLDRAARDISTSVAHIYIGSLLAETASLEKSTISRDVALHWCQMPLVHLKPESYSIDNSAIMFDGYDQKNIYGPMF